MEEVKYNFRQMFYYSERPGTLAQRKYKDDISLEIKNELIYQKLNFFISIARP